MPRRRSSQRSRVQRQSTQFGELDTTPTSHHFQSPEENPFNTALSRSNNRNEPSAEMKRLSQVSEDYSQSLADQDLLSFHDSLTESNPNSKNPESEGHSTRRSSPMNVTTPNPHWDFSPEDPEDNDSVPPISSPRSGTDRLPDTVPIPATQELESEPDEAAQPHGRVDFSDTATTARRSSPFGIDHPVETAWELGTTPGKSTTHHEEENDEETSTPAKGVHSSPHLNIDHGYNAVPANESSRVNEPRKAPGMDLTPEIGDSFETPSIMLPPAPHLDASSLQKGLGPSSRDQLPAPTTTATEPQGGRNTFQQERKASKKKPLEDESVWEIPDSIPDSSQIVGQNSASGSAVQRGKKRKQRAKSPVKFDEATQKVQKAVMSTKRSRPVRMPIVTALEASVTPSPTTASPAVVPAKRKSRQPLRNQRKRAKSPSPKKKSIGAKSTDTRTKPSTEVHPAETTPILVGTNSESLVHIDTNDKPQPEKEATNTATQETFVISSDSSSLSSLDPPPSSIPISVLLHRSTEETPVDAEQVVSPMDDSGMHMSGALETEPSVDGETIHGLPNQAPVMEAAEAQVAAIETIRKDEKTTLNITRLPTELGTDRSPEADPNTLQPTVRTRVGVSGKPIRPPHSVRSTDTGKVIQSDQRGQSTVNLARKSQTHPTNPVPGVIAVAS